MKITVYFFVIFIMVFAEINSQVIYSFGSTGSEYGKASTVDNDTNYICAALFSQTVNVNPSGITNLTSRGNIDVAIVKLDKKGNLVFGKRFGGSTSTDAPHAVGVDSQNNIYVAGYFGMNNNPNSLAAEFNPNGGGNLTTKSGYDAYLAKYDKFGNYIWALSLGNTLGVTEERAWDLVVDKSGNVYLSGGFYGSVDFNPLGSPNIKTLQNNLAGLFMAKYNKDGINEWAIPVAANDTSIFFEAYTTVDLDKEGNIIFAGNFRGTNVNFNPAGSAMLSSVGQTDMFFASYKTDGTFNWVKRVGGTLQDIISPGAMRIDKNNNIFFTGRISGTVNFNTSGGTNNVSGASLFLASYSSAGTLRFVNGMTSNAGDGGHRIAFDNENNVYMSGWMNGTVNFNPAGTANRTAVSSTADVFVAKYSNTGSYFWANNFGAANATDQNISAGLSVDQENNVYITGQFSGTNADFDPSSNSQKLLSSVGGNDCFIAKYTKDGDVWSNPTSVEENYITPGKFVLSQNYPNPFNPGTAISYQVPINASVAIKIYDVIGREIETLINEQQEAGKYTIEWNGSKYPSGIYYYELRSGNHRETKKMILMK